MNIRANLQRDSIIFKHVTSGGIILDPSRNKYVYDHWTDDYTYQKIEEECEAAGLKFTLADFNDYIASIRGYNPQDTVHWDRFLSSAWLLPGEVVTFNPGTDSFLSLLKLNPTTYLVLDAKDKTKLLSVVSTNGEVNFEFGKTVYFNPLEECEINWISLVMPDMVSRSVDYINSKVYNRNKVSGDISTIVSNLMKSLHQNEFIQDFSNIVNNFALNGISSGVVFKIADAYLRKNPIV